MNIEELYEYCMSVAGAVASTPFDESTIVVKVADKIFALIPTETERYRIILKCDPDEALKLREMYSCVEGAFHMNKKYWNSIYLDGDMPDNEIRKWIDHSVEEVLNKLSNKKRLEYYGSVK